MWGFNKGFATWVVRPASKTYRRVVFKPVRTGIGNMGLLRSRDAMGYPEERCQFWSDFHQMGLETWILSDAAGVWTQ